MKKLILAALVSSAFVSPMASAVYQADISYTFTQSGSHYVFDFTVDNTSTLLSSTTLDYFQIDFDADADLFNYSNIVWIDDKGWHDAIFGGPTSWDPYPDFGGDVAGSAVADDSLFGGNGGGIAMGASMTGFKVEFDYAGALTPYEQLFSWTAFFGTTDTDCGPTCIQFGSGTIFDPYYWVHGQATGLVIAPNNPGPGPGPGPSLPEPGIMFLMGGGLLGLFATRRRKAS